MNQNWNSRHTRSIKINNKLLKLLSEEASSPKELIDSVLRLQGMTKGDLAKKCGLTTKHVHVALSISQDIGPKVLYKMTIGLGLDPTIVFRNYGDWILKREQEKHNSQK